MQLITNGFEMETKDIMEKYLRKWSHIEPLKEAESEFTAVFLLRKLHKCDIVTDVGCTDCKSSQYGHLEDN